jgi:hypothetical protein
LPTVEGASRHGPPRCRRPRPRILLLVNSRAESLRLSISHRLKRMAFELKAEGGCVA